MRPLHFIFDLPWWVGFVLFLIGNAIVPHSYIIGMPICLFGVWTFSKLLQKNEDALWGYAIIGFPLFMLAMLIPGKFHMETPVLDLLNGMSTTATYATRAALGIFTGLFACQGLRH
jgi:hypothetical protein